MEFASGEAESSVLVLFGSETGTAESLAYKLRKTVAQRGLPCRVCGMDDYDICQLPHERYVVMIVATAGDGETPTTMRNFWRFLLNKSLSASSLQGMNVGVFGLGDSSYAKFNACARRMTTRLQQLGARHCVPLGLGDDQAGYGYYTAWNDWIEAYLSAITVLFPPESVLSLSERQSVTTAREYSVVSASHATGHGEGGSVGAEDTSAFYRVGRPPAALLLAPGEETEHGTAHVGKVVENARLTADDWLQDVRHLRIGLPDKSMGGCATDYAFRGGDVAVVYPVNGPSVVDAAMRIVLAAEPRLASDSVLHITRPGMEGRAPSPVRRTRLPPLTCSLHTLLANLLDVGGVPHRPFFEDLSPFATDEAERDKLAELGSAAGTDLYFDYCVREKKSYVECMSEFPSARPPLAVLLEMVAILQPRQFSISSSSLVDIRHVELCVGLLQRTTPYGRLRTGVCSGHLCHLPVRAEVRLWLRKGTFRNPPPSVPLILVGPGTGVAPMRALLLERIHQFSGTASATTETTASTHTNVLLFYGCRKRAADMLYREQWTTQHGFAPCSPPGADEADRTALRREAGSEVFEIQLAFSREENKAAATAAAASDTLEAAHEEMAPDSTHRPYVTHRIVQRAAQVWALLQAGAMVFVAGSANRMPADVKRAFRDVVVQQGGLDPADADRFLAAMVKKGHYYVEAWS